MKSKNNSVILVLLTLSLVNIVASYLAGHSFQRHLFNSDALYLPTLFSDLISKGGNIADWFLTPAPYFFPDYPLFFLAYLIGPSPYSQIVIFSLVQAILTFCAIWLLASQISKPKAFYTAATVSIALIWLALNSGKPFALLLVSAFHYGIFLSSIVFVALWMKHESSKENPTNSLLVLAISILVFLSTLSDNLFIVQALAPFVATAILVDISDRDYSIKKKLLLLIPAVFSVLGSISYKFFVENNTRYPANIRLGKAFSNLIDIYTIVYEAIAEDLIYGILFFIYLGVVIYSCQSLIKKPVSRNTPKQLIWLSLFSFLSLCSTLVMMTLVTNLPITTRYLIPSLSWPVVVVIFFLNHYLGQRFFAIASTVSLLVVLSLSFESYKLVRTNGLNDRYYPSEISCLDEALERANVTNGIAQYWDAKYLLSFSKLDLNIAQHTDNLRERRWITSKKYFKESYDFVIISEKAKPAYKISSEALTRINGSPERVVSCGEKSLYIYGKDKVRVKKIVSIGHSYRWNACELPTIIGEKTSECDMQKKDITQSGHVTFGPYEPLPTGRYAFEIAYSSTATKKDAVGDWDVVLALPNEAKILTNGPLAGTDGAVGKIKGEFTLDASRNMEKIEIRTLANQNMALKVIYIQVARVQ